MPYSTACNTPLSNFEAGLNYKEVSDPAVMVSFPLIDDADGAALVAWTTTPWTLPRYPTPPAPRLAAPLARGVDWAGGRGEPPAAACGGGNGQRSAATETLEPKGPYLALTRGAATGVSPVTWRCVSTPSSSTSR